MNGKKIFLFKEKLTYFAYLIVIFLGIGAYGGLYFFSQTKAGISIGGNFNISPVVPYTDNLVGATSTQWTFSVTTTQDLVAGDLVRFYFPTSTLAAPFNISSATTSAISGITLYSSIATTTYGGSILTDGGVETWGTVPIPGSWVFETPELNYIGRSSDRNAGSYAVALTSYTDRDVPGTFFSPSLNQSGLSFTNSDSFQFTFYAKQSVGTPDGMIIYFYVDESDNAYAYNFVSSTWTPLVDDELSSEQMETISLSDTWTQYTTTQVTAPSSGTIVYRDILFVSAGNQNDVALFDDVAFLVNSVNTLNNNNFETWIDFPITPTHWSTGSFNSGNGGSFEAETTITHGGSYAAKSTWGYDSSALGNNVYNYISTSTAGLTPGDIYRVSAWARENSGASTFARFGVALLNGPVSTATQIYDFWTDDWVAYTTGTNPVWNETMQQQVQYFVTTETYQEFTTTSTAPASGIMNVVLYGKGDKVGDVYDGAYVDDVSLQLVSNTTQVEGIAYNSTGTPFLYGFVSSTVPAGTVFSVTFDGVTNGTDTQQNVENLVWQVEAGRPSVVNTPTGALAEQKFVLTAVEGLTYPKGTEDNPYTVCNTGNGCDYDTLNAAFAAIGEGKYIEVQSPFTPLDQSGDIVGVPSSTYIGCASTDVILASVAGERPQYSFNADDIVINGCTIHNADFRSAYDNFTITNNIFTTSSPSVISTNTTTTVPTGWLIDDNTGLNSVNLQDPGCDNCTISNNDFQVFSAPLGSIIYIQGDNISVDSNTVEIYVGDGPTFVGTNNNQTLTNFEITSNTFKYDASVSAITNQYYYGVTLGRGSEGTGGISGIIRNNFFVVPDFSGSESGAPIISIGTTSTDDLVLDISHNTFVLGGDYDCVSLASVGSGTNSVTTTYNIFYNSPGNTTGNGIVWGANSQEISASILHEDYNGYYNLTSNISGHGDNDPTMSANSKTSNPFFKIGDVDTTNDLELAPFSDYLDANGTIDIGAYGNPNAVDRGTSFSVNSSALTLDYVNGPHATSTSFVDALRNGDTVTLAAGSYNGFSLSSLDSIILTGAGSNTYINGGAVSPALSLSSVDNSTFSNFVLQNASSTQHAYTISKLMFKIGSTVYNQAGSLGNPNWNEQTILVMTSNVCNGANFTGYDADGFDITSYLDGQDIHVALAAAGAAKFATLVPNNIFTSEAAVEAACGGLGVGVDLWIPSAFTYNAQTDEYSYDAQAVAGAGADLVTESLTTNPPAITSSAYDYGLYLSDSDANTFSGFTFSNNGSGVYFTGTSANNNVSEGTMQNSVTYDILSDATGNNNLKNTAYTAASSSISGIGNINVYLKARAQVTANSVAQSGVGVTFADSTGGSQSETVTTAGDGYTPYTGYLLGWTMSSSSIATTNGTYNPFTVSVGAYGIYSATSTDSILNTRNQTVSLAMTPSATTPTAPSTFATSTVGPTSIVLTWSDNSDNETGFVVKYSTDGESYATASTTASNIETCTVSSLTPNTPYYFTVHATNATGDSSAVTTTAQYTNASVPTTVAASANGQTSIILSWNVANNPTGTLYQVAYNSGTAIGTTTSTSYTVTGLTADTAYQFKVRAQYLSNSETWADYSDTSTEVRTATVGSSVSMTLTPGVSSTFQFTSGDNHTVTLQSSDGTTATLLIQSTPQTVSLSEGQSQNIALGSSTDTTVTMNSVSAGSASFSIASYTPSGGSNLGSGSSMSVPGPTISAITVKSDIDSQKIMDQHITLTIDSSDAVMMAISNDSRFANISYEPYQPIKQWTLTPGNGEKMVYIRLRNAQGGTTTVTKTIVVNGRDITDQTDPSTPRQPQKSSIFTELLKIGSRGTQVTKLQETLKTLKYYTYQHITGYFGSITQKALKLFQKSNYISQTGMTDERTREKLNVASEQISQSANQPTKSSFVFTKFLNVGMRGEEVKQLQLRLQDLGYMTKTVVANGNFGPATKAAVLKLQQEHGLKPALGYVGPGTREVLNEE